MQLVPRGGNDTMQRYMPHRMLSQIEQDMQCIRRYAAEWRRCGAESITHKMRRDVSYGGERLS